MTVLAACPYWAGCHPHHGAGFGPGSPIHHAGAGVHLPPGSFKDLAGLMLFAFLGWLYDVAKNGWNG